MIFSVLTPAYNASKYIENCIKSVLSQSFLDFEFIIIDDGSTDDTSTICSKYAEKDNRIKLISQQNKGVAITRNELLIKASGDWIIFVDADDYISKDYLLIFYNSIQKNSETDIFVCNYYFDTNGVLNNGKSNVSNNKKEFLRKLLKYNEINTVIWGKAIRSSLIQKNQIRFNEKIDMGEDLLFMSMLLQYSSEIVFLQDRLYYWVNNENSITSNYKYKYSTDIITVYTTIESSYKKRIDYKFYKPSIDYSKLCILCDLRTSDETKHLSFVTFQDLSYSDFNILYKILLFFLRINFIIGIKAIRKIFIY